MPTWRRSHQPEGRQIPVGRISALEHDAVGRNPLRALLLWQKRAGVRTSQCSNSWILAHRLISLGPAVRSAQAAGLRLESRKLLDCGSKAAGFESCCVAVRKLLCCSSKAAVLRFESCWVAVRWVAVRNCGFLCPEVWGAPETNKHPQRVEVPESHSVLLAVHSLNVLAPLQVLGLGPVHVLLY